MKRTARVWTATGLCLLAVVMLFANNWPRGRVVTTIDSIHGGFLAPGGDSADIPMGADGSVDLPAVYSVTLDAPKSLRFGARESMRLIVEQTGPIDPSSPFAGWQISSEASLALPGVSVQPEGSIYLPLSQEDPAQFRWVVTSSLADNEQGTLWLYITLSPPQGGSPARVIALARPVAFKVESVLGMPAALVNFLGVLFLTGGMLVGLPIWQSIKRSKNEKQAPEL